jgi:spore maturation protein CgeB
VLYVGSLQPGSTALHRMLALQQLGLEVTPFDTYPYLIEGARVARSVRHRLACGPAVSRLNRELESAASDRELDWVWIDKGVWIYHETLSTLAAPGRRLVHFAGDPMILFNRSRHFVTSIPSYHVLITTKPYEMDRYRSLGARRVILLLHGFDADLYRPRDIGPDDVARFASDVCFVGHCESHYRRRIAAAAETGADVAIWGGWERAAMWRPRLRSLVRGSGVWGEDYVKALNATKIGLGLLSKRYPDSSTTRSFEIPACGTFFLAERSAEHAQLFEEGKEAEFFNTDGEMKEKIRWYLQHEEERRRIGAAGRAKCVQAGYSYLGRMRSVVAMID